MCLVKCGLEKRVVIKYVLLSKFWLFRLVSLRGGDLYYCPFFVFIHHICGKIHHGCTFVKVLRTIRNNYNMSQASMCCIYKETARSL